MSASDVGSSAICETCLGLCEWAGSRKFGSSKSTGFSVARAVGVMELESGSHTSDIAGISIHKLTLYIVQRLGCGCRDELQ